MADPSKPSTSAPDDPYTVERVRQGEINLPRTWQKVVFFAGLIGALAFGLVMAFVAQR